MSETRPIFVLASARTPCRVCAGTGLVVVTRGGATGAPRTFSRSCRHCRGSGFSSTGKVTP